MRDAWSRLGKPQTYAQAWLSAAVLATLPGVYFLAFAVITSWQPPWPQFAIIFPAFLLVFGGLRSSYNVRRRRASSRSGA